MAGKRRYIPASEYCASVRDGTHDSPKPVPVGRKLVTSRHLTSGRLDLSDAYLISDEEFEAINKRSKVDRWDVLISMIGTVGEPCLIRDDPDFAIKNIGLFKPKNETDGRWLYYYLRSPDAQQRIREQSRGTTQEYIPLAALRDFPVLVTDDPKEQKAIAAMLGALDDKIELNRRMNATLEAMARALFQSWFVDFDPVRAKLDGRQPTGLDSDTAALFPNEFEDSQLGPIPKGWEVSALATKIELLSGGTPQTSKPEYWNGEIPWYSVKDAPADSDVWVIDTEKKVTQLGIDNSAAEVLPERTTIISARGTVGKLALTGTPMAMNQSCYGVRGEEGHPDLFTYFLLREAAAQLQQHTHGTVFDTITRQTFESVEFAFPPPQLTVAFDSVVTPLLEQMRINLRQSTSLATIRDALLPRLLSGALRLRDSQLPSDGFEIAQ